MPKILLMKPGLANLIAAGEVIERPSSVVKELVENSIDAGSHNIYVGITEGGKGKILVKDDGTGMDNADARACFLRHASSKIRTEFDLSHIKTLGFRGEAIPSIAAVSHVVLTTSVGKGAGVQVIANPNEELQENAAPSRKGTIFEVSDLFFNTPARLKYLKSEASETGSIIETVEHLALGFPGISFSLAIDGREIFRTSGRGDLLETIQKIYGNDIAQSLYPLSHDQIVYSYSGFISKPEVNYSKRLYLLTFLNHRFIYDYRINKAFEDAYKDYLPPLRYPFVILNLEIDSSMVDVNVHPTKKEVRISMEDEIARDIQQQVLTVLQGKRPTYDAGHDAKSEKDLGIASDGIDVDDLKNEEETKKENEANYDSVPPLNSSFDTKAFQDSLPFEPTYESQTLSSHPTPATMSPLPQEKPAPKDYSGKLPEMHPIGQILRTYIVCDAPDGFYLIDQHAAAERINFEKTEALFASVRSRVVPLFPITLELSFREKEAYDETHKAQLLSLGIVTEPFGDKTIKVTEIPSFLTDRDDGSIVSDVVHCCLNDDKSDPLGLMHLAIATIACKKSIKANHLMSPAEIEGLIQDLARCHNPANCPHGRPTLIKISQDDIEKIFRRSGF